MNKFNYTLLLTQILYKGNFIKQNLFKFSTIAELYLINK